MSGNSFKLEGVTGLIKVLKSLDAKVADKIAWQGGRRGAAIMKKNVYNNAKKIDAPQRKDQKFDSQIFPFVGVKRNSKLSKQKNMVAYSVGILGGATGKKRIPPTYWRFVEFGTEDTDAQPFIRPALEQDHGLINRSIAETMWKNISKELGK